MDSASESELQQQRPPPDKFCHACGASLANPPAAPGFLAKEYEELKDLLLAGKIGDERFAVLWAAARNVARAHRT